MDAPAVLVYDGACPACRAAVDWIRARSGPGAFEFLSCHDPCLPARFPGLDREACLDAARLVLPGGAVLSGADALPEVARRLRRVGWIAPLLAAPGIRSVARLAYRAFARRRHPLSRLFVRREP